MTRIRLQLPILEETEYVRDERGQIVSSHKVRTPATFGAAARWGKEAEDALTMTVIAELEDDELEKIPQIYRRETLSHA